jgi:hypothetical protein
LNVFDAYGIALYHGWVVDPQDRVVKDIIGDISYNQLITKLVELKSPLANKSTDVLTTQNITRDEEQIEKFLDSTANQLTYAGLLELHQRIKENEICVLFRNNHFSTMVKYEGNLCTLVTDMGYIDETTIVWEKLDDIDGNTEYLDAFFLPHVPQQGYSSNENPMEQDSSIYETSQRLESDHTHVSNTIELSTNGNDTEKSQLQSYENSLHVNSMQTDFGDVPFRTNIDDHETVDSDTIEIEIEPSPSNENCNKMTDRDYLLALELQESIVKEDELRRAECERRDHELAQRLFQQTEDEDALQAEQNAIMRSIATQQEVRHTNNTNVAKNQSKCIIS